MTDVSTYKVVVIGASGVGKTALVKRLVDNTFNDDNVSTVGVEFKCYRTKVAGDSIKLNIWDTAGQERFRSVSKAYFRNAVGVILVFGLDDMNSFDDLDGWMNDVHALCAMNARVIVVGNKTDLRDRRSVAASTAEAFKGRHGIDYIETSACDGVNVEEAFVRLAAEIHEKVLKGDIRGSFRVSNAPLLGSTDTSMALNEGGGGGCC